LQQKDAVIVGGTGSGKSWTVANILEKATNLKSINSIVFDLHGEYKPLQNLPNTTLLKIAGPSDKPTDENIILLPSRFASDSSEIVYFPILRGFSLFDEMIFINFDRSSPCRTF
jgi:DNA helicase HerA-like ATPase